MSDQKFIYKIEKIGLLNNTTTISTYESKNKMEVIIECYEDETTEDRWNKFWVLFCRNEARKLGHK